jgi:hypothetical protein
MKIKNTRGFGKVTDPRTGDEIDVEEPFETDRDTFEALNERYPGFEVVSEADDPKGKTEESGEEEVCGTEMTDGSLCQRPAGECPYHD